MKIIRNIYVYIYIYDYSMEILFKCADFITLMGNVILAYQDKYYWLLVITHHSIASDFLFLFLHHSFYIEKSTALVINLGF